MQLSFAFTALLASANASATSTQWKCGTSRSTGMPVMGEPWRDGEPARDNDVGSWCPEGWKCKPEDVHDYARSYWTCNDGHGQFRAATYGGALRGRTVSLKTRNEVDFGITGSTDTVSSNIGAVAPVASPAIVTNTEAPGVDSMGLDRLLNGYSWRGSNPSWWMSPY